MKHILIILFLTTTVFSQIPEYKRSYFGHGWTTQNCQDTRQKVLIEESKTDVVYETSDSCRVRFGVWYDVFNDTVIFNPKGIDIDHFCPLLEAWISGAYRFSKDSLELYANYLEDPEHLIAVSSNANRSKGAKSPDQWLPKNIDYRIEYCKIWCRIKVKWGLSVSEAEFIMLKHMLQYEDVVYPRVRNE